MRNRSKSGLLLVSFWPPTCSYYSQHQVYVKVQATVLKSKSKYVDTFQTQIQVQVQSLCYVLKSKSKYMSLYLGKSTR